MKNNSFLSSEEIIKSFLSYLDDSIYSYAYLLDGSWGSGKTFFVKEILIPSIVKHAFLSVQMMKKVDLLRWIRSRR